MSSYNLQQKDSKKILSCLNYDYNNVISPFYSIINMIETGEESFYRNYAQLSSSDYIFKGIPFKTYTEYFPLNEYDYIITPSVKFVNSQGLKIKSLLDKESQNYNELFHLMDLIFCTITGNHLK